MKAIKWLYALVFSIAFTLAIEWVGAASVASGRVWFSTLNTPVFMPRPIFHSIAWCIVYLITIYIISKLILIDFFSPFILIYAITGALSALWTVIFFRFHLTVFALTVLLIIVIFCFIFEICLLKHHIVLAMLYIPILLWYCFMLILNYCIIMIN